MANQTISYIENLIVGAGPAGLAMAARFEKTGLDYLIVDENDQIGLSWFRHYDRLHLHTLKKYSALPYHGFPDSAPKYVPKDQVANYFIDYAKTLNIHPKMNTQIVHIEQKKDQQWECHTKEGVVYHSKNLILATGLNRIPKIPKWEGMDAFEGIIKHSRDYQNGADLKGKEVLVVGFGNTGAELAIDLHEHGAKPSIVVRGEVNIIRRDFKGRPFQPASILLNKLPHFIGDSLAKIFSKITVGDLSVYGLRKAPYAASQQIRLTGKTPMIDVGTLELIKANKVHVLPGIQRFYKKEIEFTDSTRKPFDAVILATGYASKIEDFFPKANSIYNHLNMPSSWIQPQFPGLYLIGFNDYEPGFLYSMNKSSLKILKKITKKA